MAKRGKAKPGRSKGNSKNVVAEDDAALWEAFTQDIDPLKLDGRVADTDSSLFDEMLRREKHKTGRIVVAAPRSGAAKKPSQPSSLPKTPEKPAPDFAEIGAKQVRRLGSGQIAIDARIDLHGMRQNEAHGALRVFLFRAVAKGHRMVLVITGKGRAHDHGEERFGSYINEGPLGRGVLRRNVPLWLVEPDLRAIVVGYTTAHIKHGGEGALYVQLRRRR